MSRRDSAAPLSALFNKITGQAAVAFRGTKRTLSHAIQSYDSGKLRSTCYLSPALNTSLTLHLSRFKRCSKVLSVTFCSPISIRCNEEVEMPSLRAKAGKLIGPRFSRRTRPSRIAKDAAMPVVCRDGFPTCEKFCLTPFPGRNVRLPLKLQHGSDGVQQLEVPKHRDHLMAASRERLITSKIKFPVKFIVQPGSEKLPAFRRIEIASRSCLTAGFWETSLRAGCPKRGPDKAFHSPAPGAAATPGWPANPGLYSSHAVEVLWRAFPATSLSLRAVFAPARRSNFSGLLSPSMTVRREGQKSVFTHTQLVEKTPRFFACIELERMIKLCKLIGRAWA